MMSVQAFKFAAPPSGDSRRVLQNIIHQSIHLCSRMRYNSRFSNRSHNINLNLNDRNAPHQGNMNTEYYQKQTTMSKHKKHSISRIADNKKALHDFTLGEHFEAGLALQGWEVKSIRAGRVQLKESHVIIKHGEAWLLGAHISPLSTASTHITPDAVRTRKLLLHKRELNKLIGAVQKKGFTIVALNMHWSRNRVKLEVSLGKGKKKHDKRASEKEKDFKREQQRMLKNR
jgi:SsrA-binding protein